ncbi:DNA-processing protein DprA, partial [Pseudomonadota bacterium]
MDENELSYWLALLHCPGIGPARFHKLIEYFSSPQQVFDCTTEELKNSGLPVASLNWLRDPDWSSIDKDIAWLKADSSHHVIPLSAPEYPALLKETSNPPPMLFVKGDPEILQMPQLGVVGSRNPSSGGKENAHSFAKSLSQSGLTITSGMAMGIDTAAHTGALNGSGLTIAVTGTGLDRVYPARNRKLAHSIAEQGALISELPIGTPPLADNFPRRNRIISGMSLGTLVVEAAPRSGSLITAKLASEQGREVFAIPGSIHNPLARGCHALIRQGAKLIESEEDILSELGALIQLSLKTCTPDTSSPH